MFFVSVLSSEKLRQKHKHILVCLSLQKFEETKEKEIPENPDPDLTAFTVPQASPKRGQITILDMFSLDGYCSV